MEQYQVKMQDQHIDSFKYTMSIEWIHEQLKVYGPGLKDRNSSVIHWPA